MLPIPDRYPAETILIEPKRRKAQPLMTIIHGGPHGQVATAFAPQFVAYALQGCTTHEFCLFWLTKADESAHRHVESS